MDERLPANQSEPRRCVSHLKRDARFAKGKSEYKREFFIMLHPLGKKAAVAAYYLHVQPGRSYAGADAFNPPLGTLNAVREAIAENRQRFRQLLTTHAVRTNSLDGLTTAGTVQQAPRGFPIEHPTIDLVRLKGYAADPMRAGKHPYIIRRNLARRREPSAAPQKAVIRCGRC